MKCRTFMWSLTNKLANRKHITYLCGASVGTWRISNWWAVVVYLFPIFWPCIFLRQGCLLSSKFMCPFVVHFEIVNRKAVNFVESIAYPLGFQRMLPLLLLHIIERIWWHIGWYYHLSLTEYIRAIHLFYTSIYFIYLLQRRTRCCVRLKWWVRWFAYICAFILYVPIVSCFS